MSQMRKEAHMTGKDLMGMVQLRPEDVGKYAIVPGPKERMEAIVKQLENSVKNFSFMEYTMYTGTYQGTKVSTINGGRFAADTSITTEILCNAQVKGMIRAGSCGALREDIKVGDLIVVQTAIKGEGVTQYYVDKDFVPTADTKLTDSLVEVASEMAPSSKVYTGPCWTTDAILRETREHVGKAVSQGAIAVDMVSAAFLTICQLYKIPAAVILAVSDNVITGEMGFMNPDYYFAESSMVKICFE
jgi:uridine phosphorylase